MKYLVSAVLALGLATPAISATLFTDAGAFEAATADRVTTVLPNDGNVGLSATVGDLTFTSNSGRELFFGNLIYDWSTLLDGPDLAISDEESFTISFAKAVFGFSMLVHEPSAPNLNAPDGCNAARCVDTEFEINLLNGADVIGSFLFNAVDDEVNFFGATADTAFDSVQIIDLTGNLDNEYFNGFTTAAALAPIPVPASALLLLGGLGLAGASLRRKRV